MFNIMNNMVALAKERNLELLEPSLIKLSSTLLMQYLLM